MRIVVLFSLGLTILISLASCRKNREAEKVKTLAFIKVYNNLTRKVIPGAVVGIYECKKGESPYGTLFKSGSSDTAGVYFTDTMLTKTYPYYYHSRVKEIYGKSTDLGYKVLNLGQTSAIQLTLEPPSRFRLNCQNCPAPGSSDTLYLEFKHQYGTSLDSSYKFTYRNQSNFPSRIEPMGKYYVKIHTFKSGVYQLIQDTVFLPALDSLVYSLSF